MRVPVLLDDLQAVAYLDTGAGVILLGGGWLDKRRRAQLGEPVLSPTQMEIRGVNTDALMSTSGIAKVELKFCSGSQCRTVLAQGVVCPAWEGDIILSC